MTRAQYGLALTLGAAVCVGGWFLTEPAMDYAVSQVELGDFQGYVVSVNGVTMHEPGCRSISMLPMTIVNVQSDAKGCPKVTSMQLFMAGRNDPNAVAPQLVPPTPPNDIPMGEHQ